MFTKEHSWQNGGIAESNAKSCPECGYEFQGNGWDGIDAHWRAKHEHLMSYEQAWPFIQSDEYKKQKRSGEDFSQNAAHIIRKATEKSSV